MYNFQIKGKIKIMGLFTGNFYSKNLRMTTQINVIFPDVSNDVTPLYEGTPKVLYLLHGLSGNSDEWTRFSKIEYYAKKYNFIIIMPEVQRSFYTTGKDWVEKYSNDTANIPSRTDVTLTDPTTDKGYINQDIFDTLPDGSYPMQNPTSFTEISNIFDRAFSSVMAGEISPEDGCKQAAEEMRAAVKANPD